MTKFGDCRSKDRLLLTAQPRKTSLERCGAIGVVVISGSFRIRYCGVYYEYCEHLTFGARLSPAAL